LNKPRWNHSATIVPKKNLNEVYLFGGWDSGCQYNDMYVYDCTNNSMREIQTTGTIPTFRAGHTTTAFDQYIVLFGGSSCLSGPYTYYNDTYLFNTETNEWKLLNCTGQIPSQRSQHSTILLENYRLIVIGGTNDTVLFNDVYELDLLTLQWRKIITNGEGPESNQLSSESFRVNSVRGVISLLYSITWGNLIFMSGKTGTFLLSTQTWNWFKFPNAHLDLTSHISVNVSEKEVIVFGGVDSSGTFINKMYQFRME